ncbi:MAG: O-antigen ligase family protein [Actinobacteria bacterium]|nr:O-antigen ligase family protein [Actinomycetota bacterium]
MNQFDHQLAISVETERSTPIRAVGLRRAVFILLCLITFFIPWEQMLVIPGFSSVIFAVSSVALGLAVFSVLFRLRLKRPPLAWFVLALYVYWCFVSMLWTSDAAATQGQVISYVSLLLFVWMMWEFVDSRQYFMWVLRSFFLGACLATVLMFQAYLTTRTVALVEDGRYAVAGMDPNELAAILGAAIIIATYLATNTSSSWRVVYWLYIPLACVAVLLTGSRGGALGLMVCLGATLLLSGSRSWKALVLFALAAGLAIWLVPQLVPEELLERVTEGTESHTFQVRYEQWRLGLQMWSEHPFLGVGAGAFVAAAVESGGLPLVAHNTFVQTLAENGLVGMGLLLLGWALLMRTVLHLPQRERLLWLGAGLAWVVAAVALSLEYAKFTWLVYAWIMVQPACLELTEEVQVDDKPTLELPSGHMVGTNQRAEVP